MCSMYVKLSGKSNTCIDRPEIGFDWSTRILFKKTKKFLHHKGDFSVKKLLNDLQLSLKFPTNVCFENCSKKDRSPCLLKEALWSFCWMLTRSSVVIWLCLWFSSTCFGKISQNFHSFENRPADHLKAEKYRGHIGVSFLAICNFVFSSSIFNLVLWIFYYQQALGRVKTCLTVQLI